MKNIFLLYVALLISATTLRAQEPLWGTPDTLEHYTLGAGVQYTKIAYRDKPVLMWVTTIDLTNPYTQIEQVQSHNKVPDVSRETVMSMSRSNTYPGHRVCALCFRKRTLYFCNLTRKDCRCVLSVFDLENSFEGW